MSRVVGIEANEIKSLTILWKNNNKKKKKRSLTTIHEYDP